MTHENQIFIFYICALNQNILKSPCNEHKNVKKFIITEEWYESNDFIQWDLRHDEHLTILLFKHNYNWINKWNEKRTHIDINHYTGLI